MLRATGFVAALIVLAAAASPAGAQDSIPRGLNYLPYGVPVPPGQDVTGRQPEPYVPGRHGPAVANTQREANMVGRANVALPNTGRRKGPATPADTLRPRTPPGGPGATAFELPRPYPGTGDRGFYIWSSHGIYAQHDVQTDVVIPNNAVGTTIYAPTSMPASNSCVESTTAHFRYAGAATTTHGHGFWDHCNANGWHVFETMDATWKGKYARLSNGEDRFYTQAYRDASGCWHGLLYNYTLGRWEEKVSPAICGSGPRADGWTAWESYHLMDVAKVCPAFPDIRSSAIQVLTAGGWVPLTSTYTSALNPGNLCWANGTYTFTVFTANSDWQANTP